MKSASAARRRRPDPAEARRAPRAMGALRPRTLANSHPVLLECLRPGLSVLDVGAGPGALTAEIAGRVAPGPVVGIDVHPAMVRAAEAAHPPDRVPNLVFYAGDVLESGWSDEFDLVNAVRVLQWIPAPARAMAAMARAARPGGLVVARDCAHAATSWSEPPAAWQRFHRAFLEWRAAAGLDNALADHLAALFEGAALTDVRATPHVLRATAGDPDFFRVAGLWRLLAESRGRQMVASGHLAEGDRRAALESYTAWMQARGATITVHEATAVGRKGRRP